MKTTLVGYAAEHIDQLEYAKTLLSEYRITPVLEHAHGDPADMIVRSPTRSAR